MKYTLSRFDSISEDTRQKLKSIGIHTTDDVLDHAATPELRQVIADKAGVAIDEIMRIAGIADLVRIKGIGVTSAELIVSSGLANSLQQLLDALYVKKGEHYNISEHAQVAESKRDSKIRDFLGQLKEFTTKSGIDNKIPTVCELAEAGDEAQELRPRLVLVDLDNKSAFEKFISQRAKKENRHLRIFSLTFIGILVAVSGALIYYLVSYQKQLLLGISLSLREDEHFFGLYLSIIHDFLKYQNLNIAVTFVLIVTAMLILYIILERLTYLVDTKWLLFLFRSHAAREYYMTSRVPIKQEKQFSWYGLTIFAGLCILVVALSQLFSQQFISNDFINNVLFPLVGISGIFITLIAFIPTLQYYMKGRSKSLFDPDILQRSLLNHLVRVAILLLMILTLTRIMLPLALEGQKYTYSKFLSPQLHQAVMQNYIKIKTLPVQERSLQERREKALRFIDETILPSIDTSLILYGNKDNDIIETGIPLALNTMSWVALLSFALFFVVPFLVLGGWKRGLFYMVLLFFAFNAEGKLEEIAPSWFSLQRNTVVAQLLVSFVIFANALFFDWIFDLVTTKKKQCPACKTQLDEAALYCQNCGFLQT